MKNSPLKRYLKKHNLSQVKFAEIWARRRGWHVHLSNLNEYVNGKRFPSTGTKSQLEDITNITSRAWDRWKKHCERKSA